MRFEIDPRKTPFWCNIFMNSSMMLKIGIGSALLIAGGVVLVTFPKPDTLSYQTSSPASVQDSGVAQPTPTPTSPHEMVRVSSIAPFGAVKSPLVLAGEARGNWFFEGSFPVTLVDANGKVLAQAVAQTPGEWMTTEFIPFSAKLDFKKPTTSTGTIILKRDNPSGIVEFDSELHFPVHFSVQANASPSQKTPTPTPSKKITCRPTGCSGQVCADKEVMTTCEYRPEYACYKNATCEVQKNGTCGWTKDAQLTQCLEKNKTSQPSVTY